MNNRLKYPKRYRKVKNRNEVEELREETRHLRELVAKLSKLAVERFSERAESGDRAFWLQAAGRWEEQLRQAQEA